jgi:hypothetical protein
MEPIRQNPGRTGVGVRNPRRRRRQALRLELASAADSRLQQRLWALAVCGLGPNSDKGVRGCGGKG